MTGPYAQAAGDYYAAGWKPLPLPERRKALPPTGYTGNDGIDPSWPDVMAWIEGGEGAGNVALRLPRGVLGLDIDNYGSKQGAATLESGERLWGPLPPTWRTTSRDDGVSGIRLYRVPVGLRWPGTFGPGTETIRHEHRYAVAPPSVHPEGRTYRWIDPHGHVSLVPPRADELPPLPTAWVVGLTENREASHATGAGMDDTAAGAWLNAHDFGRHMCGPMSAASDHIAELMADGAHESLSGLMRLVSLAGRGHEGLFVALRALRPMFIDIAGRRRDGGKDEAAAEWTRSLFGAVDKIVGSGELPDQLHGDPCDWGVIDAWVPEEAQPQVELPPAVDNVVDEPGWEDPAETTEPGHPSEDDPAGMDNEPRPATPEELEERAILGELQQMRRKEKAKRRLQAEDAPPFRVLGFTDFKQGPEPEPIVPGLLYRDSLSRIFGAPGCGKSFLALDLAFSVALGKDWAGETVQQAPVAYVMAEGQRVNKLRAEAWQERHDVTDDELEERFYAVPDALALTEASVGPFVKWVKDTGIGLVVLDTKNAMQVGEENSATDAAIMRRALDAIRKATDACVVLIDHTGKHDGEEARGSSAVKAAMDTEIKVVNDGASPARVTVTVSRDKAAEAGRQWEFFLRMAARAAVLVPFGEDVELPKRHIEDEDAWQEGNGAAVPTELLHYEGEGGKALPDLARWMSYEASPRGADPNGVGRSMADAVRAFKGQHGRNTVTRAWSILRQREDIEPAEGIKAHTGRHVWTR